jgi:chromate transport protein ChrA
VDTSEDEQEDRLPSLGKVSSYFVLLGFINIGGPVAQITMMFNHMVEKQRPILLDPRFGYFGRSINRLDRVAMRS